MPQAIYLQREKVYSAYSTYGSRDCSPRPKAAVFWASGESADGGGRSAQGIKSLVTQASKGGEEKTVDPTPPFKGCTKDLQTSHKASPL